jgi:maleylpyruvate isomerase
VIGNPARDVPGARRAHEQLARTLDRVVAADLGAPSRLPGWTVAHVLGHLAADASSHERVLLAAARGEAVERYPGGPAQRDAEIASAARSPDALVEAVRTTAGALEEAWRAMTDASWAVVAIAGGAREPVSGLPFTRWREVEIHHVDLGLGYEPDDWPGDYVRLELANAVMVWRANQPMGLTQMPSAALALSPARRLAWLAGRLPVDGLPLPPPWL